MTTEIKVRTWLWVVLATVLVLGGGFTYWYNKGNKSIVSPTTSPTPTKSATVSPSTSARTTTTPTGNQTPSATSTPAVETKSFEATIPSTNTGSLDCNITISFKYPSNLLVRRTGGTPMVGGATWLEVYTEGAYSSDNSIIISAGSADVHTDYSPVTCATPPYEDLKNYALRNNISDYNSLTLNGSPAIQWVKSGRNHTAIQNTSKDIVTIDLKTDSTESSAYDIVINSMKIR
ncbi:MAG: hypothetical protein M1429_00160 [Patescibacteria group bacterium]|nr:hypothetical protein [Patescibacteria group bacterium]